MKYTCWPILLLTLVLVACGKGEHMRRLLVHTDSLNIANAPMDTVSYMQDVVDFMEWQGTRKERMLAYYLLGRSEADKGNSPRALELYNKAVNLADTLDNDCNFSQIAKIYGQMALIFDQQRYPQKELEMWNNAINYAVMAKDTLLYLQCCEWKSGAYWMLGDKEKAVSICDSLRKIYRIIGKPDYAAANLGISIAYNLEKGALKEAKKNIEEYSSQSGMMDAQGKMTSGHEIFYYYIGQFYEKSGRPDSAIFFYRELLAHPEDIECLENGFQGLMTTYLSLHQMDSVEKFAKLYAAANDSANLQNSANEVIRAQALYDYSESQRDAQEKSEALSRLWRIMGFCVFIVILGSCVLYRYLRKQREIAMNNIRLTNQKFLETQTRYEQAKEDLQVLHNDYKAFETKKEEQIKILQDKLLDYQDLATIEKTQFENTLHQQEIVKKMHHYAITIHIPNEAEWDEIIDFTIQALPSFHTLLSSTQPNRHTQEFRVCLLARLGFIPSELVVLLDSSSQRITNIRSKMNLKLFGQKGAKTFEANICQL